MSIFPNSDHAKRVVEDHFVKRRIPLTEDAILGVLQSPRSKWDVYWSVIALRDFGTARSVPVLKKLIHYPMQDVKDCALLTIAHIAGASETPFFLRVLAEKGSQKAYPMWAIEAVADERALSPVIDFVNTALRKIRRKRSDQSDAPYVMGLKYLARLGLERTECQLTVDLLRKVWVNVPERHRAQLRGALPAWAMIE